MKSEKTRLLAINAVIAAIYVVTTVINPIGSGAIQLRVSEALCVLPFYDRKYITGIMLGVGIANAFSPLGLIDVVVGLAVAGLAYTISKFIKNIWVNIIQYSIIAGVLVGWELLLVFNIPFMFSLVSVTASTLVMTAAGVLLVEALMKRKVFN